MWESKFETAIKKATEEGGHDFQSDPPMASSMERQTCRKCGRAVLGNSSTAYGPATEVTCKEAQAANARFLASQRR